MNVKSFIVALIGLLFASAGLGPVENVFMEFGAFVVGIALFSEWVITSGNLKRFPAMLVTWGTGVVFAFAGWLLGLGFLEPVTEVWQVAVYGVASALVANNVWPEVVKKVLEYLGLLQKKA